MRVHAKAPVFGLDIDGTIAAYHKHFRRFAEQYMQQPLPMLWADAMQGELNDALRLDKHTYRDIKLAYRQGGMKRSIPLIDSTAGVLADGIRHLQTQVWICTTRPWLRLDNIDPDTRFWLERNVGQVDGLIYGEEKYEDLIDIVGQERILGIADDLPENYERARQLGLRAILRAGDHNQWWRNQHQDAKVAFNSMDIYNQVKKWRI